MNPLQFKVSPDLGLVTVYPANLPAMADPEAYGVDLDESSLLLLLSHLVAPVYTLAELAGEQ